MVPNDQLHIGTAVKWTCVERFPFFKLSAGTGIVVSRTETLVWILPDDHAHRTEIYEEWGLHNGARVRSIEDFCISVGSEYDDEIGAEEFELADVPTES